MLALTNQKTRSRLLKLLLTLSFLSLGSCLWWASARRQQLIVEGLTACGAKVTYYTQYRSKVGSQQAGDSFRSLIGEWLSIDFVDTPYWVDANDAALNAEGARRLREIISLSSQLKHVQVFSITCGKTTSQEITGLSALPHLATLFIDIPSDNDDILQEVARIQKITDLFIDVKFEVPPKPLFASDMEPSPGISEQSFSHLARLNNLDTLNIAGIPITDRSTSWIRKIPKLKRVNLLCSYLTDRGRNDLQGLIVSEFRDGMVLELDSD